MPTSFTFSRHTGPLTRHSTLAQHPPADPSQRPCATTPKCNISALTSVMLSKPGAPNTSKRMYGVRQTSRLCKSPSTYAVRNTDSSAQRIQTQRKMWFVASLYIAYYITILTPLKATVDIDITHFLVATFSYGHDCDIARRTRRTAAQYPFWIPFGLH